MMVTIKRNNKKVRFIDLEVGDFFEFDGSLFVKIAATNNSNNSFELEESLLDSLNANDVVTKISNVTITY